VKTQPTETFGQRVARLRGAADLTQEQLAAKAELPIGSLRNYEYDHRRPRADAALRLARALGVTVEELLVLPSSRQARADVQDSAGLRSLKRAWARAQEEEKEQFLAFVTGACAREKPPVRETGRRLTQNVLEPQTERTLPPSRSNAGRKKTKPQKKPKGRSGLK
jgi:transcriptional regulator with XRE-family HTH domain